MSNSSPKKRGKYLEELADAWLAGDIRPLDPATAHDPGEVSLEELMTRLAADPAGLSLRHLLAFSDLSREGAAYVRQMWSAVPVERRRTIVRQLVGIAGEDLALQLGRLLRIALEDEDAQVRRFAIEGLMADEEISADLIGPLVQILHNDADNRTRGAAAQALGAYVLAGELDELDSALAMRVEEALMTTLLRDEEPLEVRCQALESLAYSGEIGMRQLIEDAYYAPEEEMRVSGLNAMGRSADVRWRNLARAELENPSAAMRTAAVAATGALENRAAVPELTELLSDESAEVRLAAIAALGQIGGKEVRELLEAMRLSDDPAEVEAADLALEEMMFLAEDSERYLPEEEPEAWDDEPWSLWRDVDDPAFGAYEDDAAEDDAEDAEDD